MSDVLSKLIIQAAGTTGFTHHDICSSPHRCGLQGTYLSYPFLIREETETQSGQVPCLRSHSSTGKGKCRQKQDEGRALASLSLSALTCKRGVGIRRSGWGSGCIIGTSVPHSGLQVSRLLREASEVMLPCSRGSKTSCWVFVFWLLLFF